MSACAQVYNVPGPKGATGGNGTNGTNGVNAFTVLTDGFVMPAVGDTVVAEVEDSSWIVPSNGVGAIGEVDGQVIVVEFAGSFLCTSVVDATHVLLYNLGYPFNSAPTTAIPSGAKVAPGGTQGPSGTAAGGALLAANNLSDVDDIATARASLGLGALAILSSLSDAEFTGVLEVAHGGTGASDVAGARGALGLGTMATQNAAAVAIGGGTAVFSVVFSTEVDATTLNVLGTTSLLGPLFLTASAVQSLLAASAIAPNAATLKVVGSGGAVVLVATPTITSPAVDGQILVIRGSSDVNTVTLQDVSSLAGTKLRLGAATRVLGNRDNITLQWDATGAEWIELSFTNVT